MDFKEGLEPVSPTGQYFTSSVLLISIIVVFEFEVPIKLMPIMTCLHDAFLVDPRLSSVMVTDIKGGKQWKRVEVDVQDQVRIPIFPTGLSPEAYDGYVEDYISEIAMDQFPQNKPLWEVHIIQYPTTNAAGNLIFKFHHSLGDGYTLMGVLISCLQRADNPSLPLTFASRRRLGLESDQTSVFRMVPQFFSLIFNTISDFGWSLLKTNLIKDDLSPIRSGDEGLEFRPTTISTTTFSLDHIKFIKTKLGVSINDVITGIVLYGSRLYMQEISHKSSQEHSTAIVLHNTRTISGYKSVQEMIKPDSDAPWGNRVTYLYVPIPKISELKSINPLEFVLRAHKIIKKQRNSSLVYFNSSLLTIIDKLRGPEAAAGYIYKAISHSSMMISNMIGPMEQMALANHPVKGFYFMTAGIPQSLNITMMSYMGDLRVAIGSEKGFLDPHKFKSSIDNAFAMTRPGKI
ncbi:O-acyltransferase WSD1-like [Fagus crenata]